MLQGNISKEKSFQTPRKYKRNFDLFDILFFKF